MRVSFNDVVYDQLWKLARAKGVSLASYIESTMTLHAINTKV